MLSHFLIAEKLISAEAQVQLNTKNTSDFKAERR